MANWVEITEDEFEEYMSELRSLGSLSSKRIRMGTEEVFYRGNGGHGDQWLAKIERIGKDRYFYRHDNNITPLQG
jgi:hypothetical protein